VNPPDSKRERIARWHERFVVEERYLSPASRRRLYVLGGVLVLVGALGFSAVLIGVLTSSGVHDLDAPVEQWFDGRVDPGLTAFMVVLAITFGPVALPLVILAVLVGWIVAARHLWRPLLLAAGMLTGVIIAMTLAPIVQHPRPPVAEMLFGADHSFSFPSGHVLGTSDFLLISAYLVASRVQRTAFTITAFAIAIVAIAAQIISRLYLGYHWISDTTASITLSMVILGAVILIDVHRTVRIPGESVRGRYSQLQHHGT
jgi:membrane-associated phospholipid phosphatase